VTAAFEAHVVAVALCAARLLPVSLLCPLLGGHSIPTTVRLALVLSLSLCLHLAGGVAPPGAPATAFVFAGWVGKELLFGTAIGMVASLPFDAARIGGRFIDLFRGSSAEAALPGTGTRESATGDALYQLLTALAVTGVAFPVVLGGIFGSFGVIALGAWAPAEDGVMQVAALAGAAMATGLAIGAPVAGVSLAVDCLLGMASRAAPGMNLQEAGAPLRILGGGAVVWLALGLLSERLLGGVLSSEWALHALVGSAR
jgi:type III secretion protein T